VQRYNVAASRAKDQLWLFHTVALTDVGNPEDMRFQLLDYCYGVVGRTQTDDDRVMAQAVAEDVPVEPFDSLFEQRVFNRLYDRGFTVIPQFPAEGYNIDLVVVGSKGRLAVECDGDAWHGPDAYERDLARQRDLERCGWQFFRIRESAFYVDQPAALAGLWQALDELGIYPSDWMSEQMDDADDEPSQELGSSDAEPPQDPPMAPDDQAVELAPEEPHALAPSVAQIAENNAETSALPPIRVGLDEPTSAGATYGADRLEPYLEYTGAVAPPVTASRQQLQDGLVAIVSAEGPIVGHRLHIAYVKASGGQRVGKSVATLLNSVISSAVRQGVLVADNPHHQAGVKPRTYRLPTQPEVRLRHLGPRTLDHVPPAELSELLRQAAEEHGWDNEETLFRAVLGRLGLHRLTANVEQVLTSALTLTRK
jgi:very-short-patch-repair endonuclease